MVVVDLPLLPPNFPHPNPLSPHHNSLCDLGDRSGSDVLQARSIVSRPRGVWLIPSSSHTDFPFGANFQSIQNDLQRTSRGGQRGPHCANSSPILGERFSGVARSWLQFPGSFIQCPMACPRLAVHCSAFFHGCAYVSYVSASGLMLLSSSSIQGKVAGPVHRQDGPGIKLAPHQLKRACMLVIPWV